MGVRSQGGLSGVFGDALSVQIHCGWPTPNPLWTVVNERAGGSLYPDEAQFQIIG